MGLEKLISMVRAGEPVSPGTVNRPLAQLANNTEYLWELIQAASLGSAIYARQVRVAADVQVGMPVYLNSATQQFERALAQMETDTNGLFVTAPSSQVWGIVSEKFHDTLADLLLFGYAQIDVSAAAGGTPVAGLYYLSGVTAGGLTAQRPPVTVPVLRATTDGYVYVNPTFVDFLDSHRHFRFELACSPAGDTVAPSPGSVHTITDPNADWPGWLPADHESFDGKAPEGAVFGYNLAAHPSLQAAWPPMPLAHVSMEWDHGLDAESGAVGIPLGNGGLCQVDRYGIWWMSNCYGDVPWPTSLATSDAYSESTYSEHVPPECPRDLHMSMTLWFAKINFMTDTTVVTSLRSNDSRLTISCAGTGASATTGDLEIDLDLQLTVTSLTQRGYLALKELNDGQLLSGPIAEAVYPLTSNVFMSAPFQTLRDPDNPSLGYQFHGPVGIGVLPQDTIELPAELIRLEGATEENVPVLYVGLPSDVTSSFVAKFEVPSGIPSGTHFAYRARILGRVSGTLPQLAVSYMIAPRPVAGLDTPITISESDTAMTIVTVASLAGTNQAVEAESDPIDVTEGDIVYIRVTRTPGESGDAYAGEVGFMSQVGVLDLV